ncbi:MAG: DUF2149 domain-containing protein [Thermodesulfobacteriota bacterium]|nr:DUF2149 domain-containing protein [Thermodesulfobacteriota bacterium]
MRYLNKRRIAWKKSTYYSQAFSDDDPLSGLANLFDIGLVFIVGLILALFSTYHMEDMLNDKTEITIMKKFENGEMEIISKKGKKVNIKKITKAETQGRGERLGTAYKLENGSMVYVPD